MTLPFSFKYVESLQDPDSKLLHAFDNKDRDGLVTAIETVCSQALTPMPLTATPYISISYALFPTRK